MSESRWRQCAGLFRKEIGYVVFDENKSYISNKKTGEKNPIDQENGTYVINVEYLIASGLPDHPSEAGFPRPAR